MMNKRQKIRAIADSSSATQHAVSGEQSTTTMSTAPPPKLEQTMLFGDSHSALVTTICLNGANYLWWSQSVKMYIHSRGKLGYLTTEQFHLDVTDPKYAVWDAENSTMMTWLVNSMEEDICCNYMCYPIAKELWDSFIADVLWLGDQVPNLWTHPAS